MSTEEALARLGIIVLMCVALGQVLALLWNWAWGTLGDEGMATEEWRMDRYVALMQQKSWNRDDHDEIRRIWRSFTPGQRLAVEDRLRRMTK